MYIEPLIIMPLKKSVINSWQHPMIESLTDGFEKMECGNILGNFLKTTIEYEDGKLLQLVTLTDDEMYEKAMNGEINEYVSFLDVVLSEDVWVPGNEQFIFSDYGKAFDSVYGFSNNSIRVSITPDVSLATDGSDWWWDT